MDISNFLAPFPIGFYPKMPDKITTSNIIKPKFIGGKPGHVLDAKYFYYETQPTSNSKLAIVCGGYEKCAPDFELNRSDYPYHVVKYTVKGKGSLNIHSKLHSLQAGTLSSFSPGIPHQYKANPDDPLEHIFITFLGKEAKHLLIKSTLYTKGALDVPNPDKMLHFFQTILNNGLEKSEYSQQVNCSYLRILLLELASEIASSEKTASLSEATYKKTKKYIDDNFSKLYSVRQVADHCQINIRYMSRLFKLHNYMSPRQYITRLKMNKAATLLLNSNFTVSHISLEVGYEDPYHFSRCFKKHFGLSPRHYREKHL